MENFDSIRQLVDAVAARNMVDANLGFDNIMADKVQAALSVERQRLAGSMFGDAENDSNSATDGSDAGAAE